MNILEEAYDQYEVLEQNFFQALNGIFAPFDLLGLTNSFQRRISSGSAM